MGLRFKRKLYPRGGSFETTIPVQMLFSLDLTKKHYVNFEYDINTQKWFVNFEEHDEHLSKHDLIHRAKTSKNK